MSDAAASPAKGHSPPAQTAGAAWLRTLLALLCALFPSLLAWAVFESPWMSFDEPTSMVATPNPQKAPYPFVTQTQERMVYASPRLAIFAERWKWVVYSLAVLWALAAPRLYAGRFATPGWRSLALISASLLLGCGLGWPWLAVLCCAHCFGP